MRCDPPPKPENNSCDAGQIALKDMYDLYGLCAGRLVDLVNYLQESH